MPTEENLTIEKLVYGGDGLSRLESKVVFTPFVLPGEKVRAEIDRIKNDLWRGQLLHSPGAFAAARVTAPCPYFQRCGGCHYQHAEYAFQVEQKRVILREALRRVGKIEFAGEIEAITGEPWAYRNRVQLHIVDGAIGYFEHGSHTLCAIDHCPIVSPALNDAISKLHGNLGRISATVELFTNESVMQVSIEDRVPHSVYRVFESLGTNAAIEYNGFRVSRNSFFQVNRYLVDRLVECAIGEAAGETAVDLYAGVGLFAVRSGGALQSRDRRRIERQRFSRSGAQRTKQGDRGRRGEQDQRRVSGGAWAEAGSDSRGSAARRVRQARSAGSRAHSGAAVDDCFLRSGYARAGFAGIAGRGVSDRQADAGGSVPADVSHRDRGAPELFVGQGHALPSNR